MTSPPFKPTAEQIRAAAGKQISDILAPGLRLVFCGINPGLYSGATGHHFARPGNRFWPTLLAAKLTPRLYSPFEDRALLALGLGITNLVDRTTATAAELTEEELRAGATKLEKKIAKFRPRAVAFLGVTAYRAAFGRKKAGLGLQPERFGETTLWVLPNPSGLNAHYNVASLAKLFREVDANLR